VSFDDFLGQLSRHLFLDTDPGAIRAGEHDAFLLVGCPWANRLLDFEPLLKRIVSRGGGAP